MGYDGTGILLIDTNECLQECNEYLESFDVESDVSMAYDGKQFILIVDDHQHRFNVGERLQAQLLDKERIRISIGDKHLICAFDKEKHPSRHFDMSWMTADHVNDELKQHGDLRLQYNSVGNVYRLFEGDHLRIDYIPGTSRIDIRATNDRVHVHTVCGSYIVEHDSVYDLD